MIRKNFPTNICARLLKLFPPFRFGGGGGGLRDPRHDPLREPRRPPVNPDWDRDRFPMGYDPLRPGAGIPPFGAGGIGRPPQPAPPNPFNPRGGGSFGGPRFL